MFYILLIIVLYCIWRIPTMKLQNLIYKFIFSQNLQDQDSLLFIFFFQRIKSARKSVHVVESGTCKQDGGSPLERQEWQNRHRGRVFWDDHSSRQLSSDKSQQEQKICQQ